MFGHSPASERDRSGRSISEQRVHRLAPTFVVGKDLAEGRLVSLMPDYKPVESELSAIYPPGKHPSAKVRSLIDFLAARFGPEPPWDEWRRTERTKKSNARTR